MSDRRQVEACEMRGTVTDQCMVRADPLGLEIKGRLESIIDLPAAEAVCITKVCHTRFMYNHHKPGADDTASMGRPQDRERLNTFQELCDWLEAWGNRQYTLDELRRYMSSCTDSGAMYSLLYLKKKTNGTLRKSHIFCRRMWMQECSVLSRRVHSSLMRNGTSRKGRQCTG
jgi:hypothetical protein